MSTQRTHVVALGLSLDEQEFELYKVAYLSNKIENFFDLSEDRRQEIIDDVYDDELTFSHYNKTDSKNNLVMIQDGQSGKYQYVGIILSRAEDYEGLQPSVITVKELKQLKKKVIKKFAELDFSINKDKVSLIILTHWQ